MDDDVAGILARISATTDANRVMGVIRKCFFFSFCSRKKSDLVSEIEEVEGFVWIMSEILQIFSFVVMLHVF